MVHLIDIAALIASLVFILLSCEVFVNGIEQLGCRLRLSEGATGSILAAVGTAMPETIIPIIAIMLGTEEGIEIGTGAILGAPFMLATLAMFVGGATVLIARSKKGRSTELDISVDHARTDLKFFMGMYALALVSTQFNSVVKPGVAVVLLAGYVYYARSVWREGGEIEKDECAPLYLGRFAGGSMGVIVVQVLAALGGIIIGARVFVGAVEGIAAAVGISPFVLAFIIAPVATELPEKFNSALWYWREKDALAMGNVTGAMVFQSSIPVSIGILFTPWELDIGQVSSVLLAIGGAALLYASLKVSGRINAKIMLVGGLLYAAYVSSLLLG